MRLLLFLIISLFNEIAYGQSYFEKFFYNQHGVGCAREDSAGNIIVSFPSDGTITKLDSLANPIWSRTYNFSISTFDILSNGNWICGGTKLIGSVENAIMAMLDANGNTIWTRIVAPDYPGSAAGVYQMKIDNNGNSIFVLNNPQFIYKLDNNGNELEGRSFYSYGNDFHFNVTSSNGIATAQNEFLPVGANRCQVDAYDSVFNHLWYTEIYDSTGPTYHNHFGGIVFPNTGNDIVIGGCYDWYLSLFILSASGNWYSGAFMSNSGRFVDVISVSLGGYLAFGFGGGSNGWAIRIGPNYNIGWSVDFPGINGVIPYFAQETKDGGFLISGTAKDSSNNNIPWMTKIDQNGNIPTGVSNIKKSVHNIQIKCLNNSIEVDQAIGDKLIISDMNGKVVQSFEELSDKFVFNFNERGGIYIFSFYNLNELVESKKVFIPLR